jgi:hypothetical protein
MFFFVLNCTNLLDVQDSWKQGERDNRHIERSAKKTRDSQLPVLMITTDAALVMLQLQPYRRTLFESCCQACENMTYDVTTCEVSDSSKFELLLQLPTVRVVAAAISFEALLQHPTSSLFLKLGEKLKLKIKMMLM